MPTKKNILFLEHTADIKVQVRASSEEKLFETCAKALSSYMVRNAPVKKKKNKEFYIDGTDHYALLYKMLDEIIYLADAEGFIGSSIKVSLTKKGIDVKIKGDDAKKYTLTQVKAATYAEMEIKKEGRGWKSQFVLDV